ncbi:DUF975 family protein [Clostridium perfringens]|nr:DUF975 family protein [Clostridium perfringens]
MTRREIKSLAKDKLKGRWTNFVLLTLIIAAIELIVSFLINRIDSLSIFSILNICNYVLLAPALSAAGIIYTIKFVDSDEKLSMKEALPTKKIWVNFIKIMLATAMFVLPAILVIFGAQIVSILTSTVSQIIAYSPSMFIDSDVITTFTGIIVIAMIISVVYCTIISLFLFPLSYVMTEEQELGVWEGVGKSFRIMKGHKWELFVLGLSFIGWGILAVLTLGIGMLWLMPYMHTTMRIYYLSISDRELGKTVKFTFEEDFEVE